MTCGQSLSCARLRMLSPSGPATSRGNPVITSILHAASFFDRHALDQPDGHPPGSGSMERTNSLTAGIMTRGPYPRSHRHRGRDTSEPSRTTPTGPRASSTTVRPTISWMKYRPRGAGYAHVHRQRAAIPRDVRPLRGRPTPFSLIRTPWGPATERSTAFISAVCSSAPMNSEVSRRKRSGLSVMGILPGPRGRRPL